jgi:hypothetical protein
MPTTFKPPRSRVGRLLTRADRLAAWSRAQAYLTWERPRGPQRNPAQDRPSASGSSSDR